MVEKSIVTYKGIVLEGKRKCSPWHWSVLVALVLIVIGVTLVWGFYLSGIKGITGRATSQVYVANFYGAICNITVQDGWNLISIACDSDNMSRQNVLATIEGNYSSIHCYESQDSKDKWKAYKAGLPEWVVHDLTEIDTTKGYWINMLSNASIDFEGNIKYPTYTSLYQGWNLVGYPTNMSGLVNVSFQDILSRLVSVHLYNASDTTDHWKVYSNTGSGQNDLEMMIPGFGYWVLMNGSGAWVVDKS